jgi:GxxExxY protein
MPQPKTKSNRRGRKERRGVRRDFEMSLSENEIGGIIVDRALRVHRELGPGLLESTYEACLCHELREAGLDVEVQKALPVVYKSVKLDCGYRIDVLVEKKVVVEIKSVEALNDVHLAQILTYLKLSECRLGSLINFNVRRIKEGIRRVVNQLSEETQS